MPSMECARARGSSYSPGSTSPGATCCAFTHGTIRRTRCRGVFNTRSADRPNPIGLHEVEVLAVEGARLHVRPLEAIDGTPVVDLKPVLD